jgi:integrase
VKNVHGILHKALEQALKLRYIGLNPADACTLPRMEQREIKPLDEREISAFLREIESGEALRDLFTVALFTGMREGEICGLSWDAVDLRAGTITVKQQLCREKRKGGQHYIAPTKNDKARTLTPAPFIMDILKNVRRVQSADHLAMGLAWQNEWNLVFTDKSGRYIVPQTALKRFKAVAARIGRPDARFHDLRHTYAVTALQEGDDVKTVQENLGHATASFTLDVYGHVSEKMKKESAARMQSYFEKIKA